MSAERNFAGSTIMKLRARVSSKAIPIFFLSFHFQAHRLCRSFQLRRNFGIRAFGGRQYHLPNNSNSFSVSRASFIGSKKDQDSDYFPKISDIAQQEYSGKTNRMMTASSGFDDPISNSEHTMPSEVTDVLQEIIVSCIDTDKLLSEEILTSACSILRQFIEDMEPKENGDDCLVENGELSSTLSSYASIAAIRFCQKSEDGPNKKKRKQSWFALQNAAEILLNASLHSEKSQSKTATKTATFSLESNALAVCMVIGALSLYEQQQIQQGGEYFGSAKAAASALSTSMRRNEVLRKKGQSISSLLLLSFINSANIKNDSSFDLGVLNHVVKSFQLTNENVEPSAVAAIVRKTIKMKDTGNQNDDFIKRSIAGSFALACQLRPWAVLSPTELIDVATAYDFYDLAEDICESAHEAADMVCSGKGSDESGSDLECSISRQQYNAKCAVEELIDKAAECRFYRRAEGVSDRFFYRGGQSRYVKVRYLHSRDTIARVILENKFPIVEQRIQKFDKAIKRAESYNKEVESNDTSDCNVNQIIYDSKIDNTEDISSIQTSHYSDLRSLSVELRNYTIQKCEEAGEIAAAQRFASVYNIDYTYDEEAARLAAARRKEMYLQFEDVLEGEIPTLITEPEELISRFDLLLRINEEKSLSSNNQQEKLIGFDAEWDEDTKGVALLQLASFKTVLLIDIITLSLTKEGVNALEMTVGKLFSSEWTVVGFACSQDLSRLRASPCMQKERHWLSMTSATLDLKPLIGIAEDSLKTTGLSRACKHFLGKPLDKSEQCSFWSARPLSEKQRSYASLDAWVCVAIYRKLHSNENAA